MNRYLAPAFYLAFLLLPLSACGVDTDLDQRTANHIGRPAFMAERFIPAGTVELKAWERMHERGAPATVYIEDLGPIVADRSSVTDSETLWKDPTPSEPTGLLLASRDKSANLGYLAGPCQYLKNPEGKGCPERFWREDRYSPVIIDTYMAALDDMVRRYSLNGVHLVGFGGGANVAAVLAAKRSDVLSLRTVAGDLSPAFTDQYSGATSLSSNAVLAPSFADRLRLVPQHHFIGAADQVIPPGTYHSYRNALGESECINYSVIQDATHKRGWVQIWPELLALMPECAVVYTDLPPLPPAPEFPGDFYK